MTASTEFVNRLGRSIEYVTPVPTPYVYDWDQQRVTHIVRWYDRFEKYWVVYRAVEATKRPRARREFWQVGAASFVYSKDEAIAEVAYLIDIDADDAATVVDTVAADYAWLDRGDDTSYLDGRSGAERLADVND